MANGEAHGVKLVFLGTPEFAVPTLEACVTSGHDVVAVYTQPDRPKGRGRELTASPVKLAARVKGISVRQPEKIRETQTVEELRQTAPDAMIVVGYGQIVPQSIIDIPRYGILNVHASLLPKYRGAAPIQRAIAEGEAVTGVTIMKIDAGLDTGDMLHKVETPIGVEETAVELGSRLAVLGAAALVETLARIDSIVPEKQNDALATLAPQLRKEEGQVDWTLDASTISNRARGFQPWPGCYTAFRDRTLHIFRCQPSDESLIAEPGTLIARRKRMFVACGHASTLELLEVQLDGRRRASAADFLNGQHIGDNQVLGAKPV